MYRLRIVLLAFIATATVFIACRKEPHETARVMPTGIAKTNECEFQVALECGMLSFPEQADFEAMRICIEERYEAFLAWLEQEYGTLDDDDFDNAVEQLGANEDSQILEILSTVPGFYSYWQMHEAALNEWLDGGGEPWTFNMPYPFSNAIEGSLRNTLGAVMIGGTI